MTEELDHTGRRMARKHSRRGVLRLAGAGLLGATAAAVLPAVASADRQFTPARGLWFANVNGQNFNVLQPVRLPKICVDCD